MDKLQEIDWISSWMDDPESEKITLDMIQSRNRKEQVNEYVNQRLAEEKEIFIKQWEELNND